MTRSLSIPESLPTGRRRLARRTLLAAGAGAAVGATLAGRPQRSAAGEPVRPAVRRWAADTWACLEAMTDERTGLPADNIAGTLEPGERSGYTSPTNIGGYLWCTVAARELGLISRVQARRRLARTVETLAGMQHNKPSGMFYNWYDEATGEVLTEWPGSGDVIHPFLSSVDNGWLVAGLMIARSADPAVRRSADRVLDRFDFKAFYNPDARPGVGAGLLAGGFWEEPPPDRETHQGNFLGHGPDVFYTLNHYDTTISETRISSYLGIGRGEVPPEHYFATWRTFPDGCDWAWQQSRPVGETRTYLGIDVFEGAYEYRGMRIVPGWGGSMFEALMPNMFVPEEHWAPRSWGVNHRLFVRAQREHGLHEAGYGSWGFSPASDPMGGYSEWGLDAVGLNPDGYPSDVERTDYDPGFEGCREAGNPKPDWGDGVVTPHALFLAMHHEPRQAYDALIDLERRHGCYGPGGFYDAVAVGSGTVAERYLSLDQAMVLGSLGNVFAHGAVRRHFAPQIERRVRPVLAMEEFGAGE